MPSYSVSSKYAFKILCAINCLIYLLNMPSLIPSEDLTRFSLRKIGFGLIAKKVYILIFL